jgi:hypothetical protein
MQVSYRQAETQTGTWLRLHLVINRNQEDFLAGKRPFRQEETKKLCPITPSSGILNGFVVLLPQKWSYHYQAQPENPCPATNSNWVSTQYWNVSDWNQFFFRLQLSP